MARFDLRPTTACWPLAASSEQSWRSWPPAPGLPSSRHAHLKPSPAAVPEATGLGRNCATASARRAARVWWSGAAGLRARVWRGLSRRPSSIATELEYGCGCPFELPKCWPASRSPCTPPREQSRACPACTGRPSKLWRPSCRCYARSGTNRGLFHRRDLAARDGDEIRRLRVLRIIRNATGWPHGRATFQQRPHLPHRVDRSQPAEVIPIASLRLDLIFACPSRQGKATNSANPCLSHQPARLPRAGFLVRAVDFRSSQRPQVVVAPCNRKSSSFVFVSLWGFVFGLNSSALQSVARVRRAPLSIMPPWPSLVYRNNVALTTAWGVDALSPSLVARQYAVTAIKRPESLTLAADCGRRPALTLRMILSLLPPVEGFTSRPWSAPCSLTAWSQLCWFARQCATTRCSHPVKDTNQRPPGRSTPRRVGGLQERQRARWECFTASSANVNKVSANTTRWLRVLAVGRQRGYQRRRIGSNMSSRRPHPHRQTGLGGGGGHFACQPTRRRRIFGGDWHTPPHAGQDLTILRRRFVQRASARTRAQPKYRYVPEFETGGPSA